MKGATIVLLVALCLGCFVLDATADRSLLKNKAESEAFERKSRTKTVLLHAGHTDANCTEFEEVAQLDWIDTATYFVNDTKATITTECLEHANPDKVTVTILIEKVSVPRGIRKLRLRLRGAVLSGAFKDALEGLGLDTYLPV